MKFEMTVRCVVDKLVTVECESEELAVKNPWDYAIDELEIDMVDWEVVNVRDQK